MNPSVRKAVRHAVSSAAPTDKGIHARGYFVRATIRKQGQTVHRGQAMSNAMAEVSEARNLVKILVGQEARRTGDRIVARRSVARSLGVAPGTIENIQRSRLTKISGWLRDALRARVIRELESEIARLQHELAVHKQTGVDPRGDEATAVRADLSAILAVLGRDRVRS